jgi:hypothetical protein
VFGTGAGFAGHDQVVARAIHAVDAMVKDGASVTATVDHDTLTLRRPGIVLVLQRAASLPVSAPTDVSTSLSAPAPRPSQNTPVTEPGNSAVSP